MTISTPHTDPAGRRAGDRGVSLAEVMVATALGAIIIASVMGAFLYIGRTSLALGNYQQLETESRHGLELFANDARSAANLQWKDPHCLTFYLPSRGGVTPVATYGYDDDPKSPTFGTFYRQAGLPDSTVPREPLIHGIDPDFTFNRFKLEQPGVFDRAATNDLETKQIQVVMRSSRTASGLPTASHATVSATYVLRNKR